MFSLASFSFVKPGYAKVTGGGHQGIDQAKQSQGLGDLVERDKRERDRLERELAVALREKAEAQAQAERDRVLAESRLHEKESRRIPPQQNAENSHKWCVVIGINSYKDGRIPTLATAEADAEGVAKAIGRGVAFPPENVMVLKGQDATQQKIRSTLGTWLARKAGKNDLVVIFFAGHGAPETDLAKKSPDGLVKYLVPYDARADDLFGTGIPMSEIAMIFDRIEAQRIIFISDACYSGAAGGRSFALGNFRGVQIGDPTAELAKGKGRVILTAGDANEPAVEDKTLGHGVFTYFLLEGLAGKAADGEGNVTLSGLYKYVCDKVTRKSKELGGNQHPVMKGELQGDIILVPAPARSPSLDK